MRKRSWIGMWLAFTSLLLAISGWVASVQTAPTAYYPQCKGELELLNLCDKYARNITGIHMIGIVGSVVLGLAGIVASIIYACTSKNYSQ